MHDFGTQSITLSTLVKLTNQFVDAAQYEIKCRDVATPDLSQKLTPEQKQRMRELRLEADEINAQAEKLMQSQNDDPAAIGSLTAQMNLVALQMCDVLIDGAQKLLGREYLTFIAPDELRRIDATELLQLNRADTLAGLTKITLQ